MIACMRVLLLEEERHDTCRNIRQCIHRREYGHEYAAICDTAIPPERQEANTDTAAPIELIFIPLPNASPMESCDASMFGIPRTM